MHNHGELLIGADGNVGGDGIENPNTIFNGPCGIINTFSYGVNNTGTIDNEGLLLTAFNGTHINDGTFNNDGILDHATANLIPNVTNNEILISPTTGNCGGTSPAFDLGAMASFNILGVYTDTAATQPAGTYDQNANTFNPTTSINLTQLFVEIENPVGECTFIAPWAITLPPCCFDLPIAKCKPYEAILDPAGNVTISVSDVDDGSSAICGLQNLEINKTDFNCSHTAVTQQVTLTITDVNGNSDNCTADISVTDNENANCHL